MIFFNISVEQKRLSGKRLIVPKKIKRSNLKIFARLAWECVEIFIISVKNGDFVIATEKILLSILGVKSWRKCLNSDLNLS